VTQRCCGSGFGKKHFGFVQLRIRNESELKIFSEKVVKLDNFSTKMLNLKIKTTFCKKKISLKTRQEYNGKIYVKNIRKNFM
jgi:hypothetical protein